MNVEGQLCYGAVKLAHIYCESFHDGSLFSLQLVQISAAAESRNISAVGSPITSRTFRGPEHLSKHSLCPEGL